MATAAINGFQMYYEIIVDGPPVLYLHGGMGGARSVLRKPWGKDSAIPGYQFVFFDRQGTGRSEAPSDGYDLGTFGQDAWALMDHLGVEATVVFGNVGGRTHSAADRSAGICPGAGACPG